MPWNTTLWLPHYHGHLIITATLFLQHVSFLWPPSYYGPLVMAALLL